MITTILPNMILHKIEDDWWIVSYVYNVGSFPDDCHFLCDTLEGVEEWFRESL